jgi:colicin import membrane protein
VAAVALSVGRLPVPDRSIRWSLVGHGVLLLLVVIGGISIPHAPTPTQLAIKATVVDSTANRRTREPPALPRQSKPQPKPQPQPEPQPKPAVKPEPKPGPRTEPRAQELKAEQLRAKDVKARELKAKELKASQALEAKAAAERAKAEAERLKSSREKAEAEEREAARLAAARELLQQLKDEEELEAASNSGALADYVALIRQKVERNWVRPPGARAGIECEVSVTQIPGGQVTSVRTERCNADEPVRRSIEAAVLRASPLPLPAESKLFERNLRFTFKPEQ